ncbi:hypothetical protein KC357_g244 [Hortaea werneckii]|nr:hypothetical protein KC357_g244 [Hortaea werneckii]
MVASKILEYLFIYVLLEENPWLLRRHCAPRLLSSSGVFCHAAPAFTALPTPSPPPLSTTTRPRQDLR